VSACGRHRWISPWVYSIGRFLPHRPGTCGGPAPIDALAVLREVASINAGNQTETSNALMGRDGWVPGGAAWRG
jgi:hypothetical protein